MSSWTRFKSWIYKSGLGIRPSDADKSRPKTHFMLDGGKMSVPHERQDEFDESYARALFEGEPVFVVELKTSPVYYLMFEFDLKMPRGRLLSDEELRLFVSVVQRVVAPMFSDFPNTSVAVLTAPPKDCVADPGAVPATQNGIHMVWKIPVNSEAVWKVRAVVLRELESRLTGVVPFVSPWLEMFDPCVLMDNGLRMVGSRKAEICPDCKKKKAFDRNAAGLLCARCQGQGHLDNGRPYSLAFYAGPDGAEDGPATKTLKDPLRLYDLVKACSIRACGAPLEAVPVLRFACEPDRLRAEANAAADRSAFTSSRRKNPKAAAATADARKEKRAESRDELIDLTPDQAEYRALANFILTEFVGTPVATHVKRCKSKDIYIVNSKCHWCANKRGDHAHSFVYFYATPVGVVQRCFCFKSQADGVSCRNFCSEPRKLSKEDLTLLFPQKLLTARRKAEKNALVQSAIFDAAIALPPLPPGAAAAAIKKSKDKMTPKMNAGQFQSLVSSNKYKFI